MADRPLDFRPTPTSERNGAEELNLRGSGWMEFRPGPQIPNSKWRAKIRLSPTPHQTERDMA